MPSPSLLDEILRIVAANPVVSLACPSGVQYGALLEATRQHVNEAYFAVLLLAARAAELERRVGERTAELIKMGIGTAYPTEEELTMDIKGRDLVAVTGDLTIKDVSRPVELDPARHGTFGLGADGGSLPDERRGPGLFPDHGDGGDTRPPAHQRGSRGIAERRRGHRVDGGEAVAG